MQMRTQKEGAHDSYLINVYEMRFEILFNVHWKTEDHGWSFGRCEFKKHLVVW